MPALTRTQRNLLITLAIVAGSLLVLAIVRLAADGTPSSEAGLTDRLPLLALEGDDGCENFATYWTGGTSAEFDTSTLERFTNCRQIDEGNWMMSLAMYAADVIDPETLTDEQRLQWEELHARISGQAAELQAALPDSVENGLDSLYGQSVNPVIGHLKEGALVGPTRTRYARVVNAFMLDPKNRELTEFIGWTMARKIDSYAQFRRECIGSTEIAYLHAACRGMEDALNIRYAPFPWDLEDNALIDTYFNETVVQPSQESEA